MQQTTLPIAGESDSKYWEILDHLNFEPTPQINEWFQDELVQINEINFQVCMELIVNGYFDKILVKCFNTKKSPKGSYFRSYFSLDGYHVIEVPRPVDNLMMFQIYGLLPRMKYSLDVILEVTRIIKQEKNNPEDTAERLRKLYPNSLGDAKISKTIVKKVLLLLQESLSSKLPLHPITLQPYALLIDTTVRIRAGPTLLVILAIPIQELGEEEDDDSSLGAIPLVAEFVASGDHATIIRALMKVKNSLSPLALEPEVIIADFSPAILPFVDRVFPNSKKLGCHFHFLEILRRAMIDDVLKRLRDHCSDLLTALKKWTKRHRYGFDTTDVEVMLAKMVDKILNKVDGRLGENLIDALEKLQGIEKELRKKLSSSGFTTKAIRTAIGSLQALFAKNSWKGIRKAVRDLKERLLYYSKAEELLAEKFESEAQAKQAVLKLIEIWQDNAKVLDYGWLIKATEAWQRHIDYLIPSMADARYPRTTSPLEGLHGRVKKLLRKWGGLTNPSTFDWVAAAITLLTAFTSEDLSAFEFQNEVRQILDADALLSATLQVKLLGQKERRIRGLMLGINQISDPKEFRVAFSRLMDTFTQLDLQEGMVM